MSDIITSKPIVKNDKRTITAWAFFDWANSAYALVITVAIFPSYFTAMTPDRVHAQGQAGQGRRDRADVETTGPAPGAGVDAVRRGGCRG